MIDGSKIDLDLVPSRKDCYRAFPEKPRAEIDYLLECITSVASLIQAEGGVEDEAVFAIPSPPFDLNMTEERARAIFECFFDRQFNLLVRVRIKPRQH